MTTLTSYISGWSWRVWPASSSTDSARPEITQTEAKSVLHYAFATPAICTNQWETWLKPSGFKHLSPTSLSMTNLPRQIEKREFCFFDPETALKVALFEKGNDLLVVFGALNSSSTEVDDAQKSAYMRKLLCAGGYNLVWGRPLVFQRACELVTALKEMPRFKHLNMVLTGHSFGGGIASYAALKLNCRAICFNSLPLGSWVKHDIGTEGIKLADRMIRQITIAGDWLSDNFLIKYRHLVSAVFTLPSLPGRRVFVPTAYPTNRFETHSYIVGSLLVHTGFDKCDQPASIVPKLFP